jgi:capsid portal protein
MRGVVTPRSSAPIVEPDKKLRAVAKDYLDHLCRDTYGAHVTPAEWGSMMIWDYKSTGQCYAEVLRGNSGGVTAYIHIPSRLIRRHVSGRAYAQIGSDGKEVAYFRRFKFTETKAKAPEIYFSQDEAATMRYRGKQVMEGELKPELIDHKIYHPQSDHYGIPPIIAALTHLVGNIYSQNRNLRFFFNRGMPDYLVIVKADAAAFGDPLQGPLINQFVDSIEEHMKFLQEGEDYRVLTVRLPTGQIEVTLEKLGTAPQDQEFAGYQEDNSKAIVRVYRMLPHRLGIIETASLGSGTGESQEETYKRSQIDPLQSMLEGDFDSALDSAMILALRAKYAEIDVLDEAREMSLYVQASGVGDISINEGRAWLSRIVKDQDFPQDESDWADIPRKLLELQLAQLIAPGEGGVRTFAAGIPAGNMVRSLLTPSPGVPDRPSDAEDQAALAGRGRILDRMRGARTRMLGNGGQIPQPSESYPGGFRREAVRL